jgi:hypothetical protein
MTTRAVLTPLLFLSLPAAGPAQQDAPDWARQAASRTVPAYPAKVSSVVLFQEEAVTVDVDGRRVMRERGAIRILQKGAENIAAYRTYDTKNGRIRDFQGWLISASGKSVPYARNRIIDQALSTQNTYDEAREKVLECGIAEAGSVFAWEVVEEEKTVFTQYSYGFQGQSPVLDSRFTLTLPAGWEAKGLVFNRDKVEPQVSGSTWTWELRDLPWIELEDHSPSFAALAPRIVVSYFPPSDNRAGLQGLKDWTAVSVWLSTLVDPPAEVSETVRAKAAQLTANAPGELDKIRAIAAFVQQTNYVEVALNVTHGGGYTPHRSEETLARNYGDCKDKATLMRSLLKAAGMDSYLTVITADDRAYVRPEWASPAQFDHAIVAVRVSDNIELGTVLKGTPLGPLLIFDPTDRLTRLGDLPEEEQGSYALVVAGARGALLRMPLLHASANRIESSVEGAIGADGRLEARIRRQYFGQSSIPLRATEMLRGSDDLKKRLERGFGRRLAATTVSNVATESRTEENALSLHLELAAERFAQMQGRLLIARPGVLTSGGDYFFTSKQRTAPIELDADLRRDSIRIKLPAGFKLDELPGAVKIESRYGTLEASWTVQDAEIVMEQTLEIREATVPAAEYAQVRDFFDRVAGAQNAPVVLVKQ